MFFINDILIVIWVLDIIYIVVGMLMFKIGEVDLMYVKLVVKIIGEYFNGYKVIVNKSIVLVGIGKLV